MAKCRIVNEHTMLRHACVLSLYMYLPYLNINYCIYRVLWPHFTMSLSHFWYNYGEKLLDTCRLLF